MQDLVALGTGNSRLMKSNISPSTNLSELISMLNNGTFPYDIGPLNAAGISQQGTALNKANLLSDETAAALGLPSTAVPDDAFMVASKVLQAGNCKIVYGSYTGNGDYSSDHKNSLTFSGQPLFVVVMANNQSAILIMLRNVPMTPFLTNYNANESAYVLWDTPNSVSWYANSANYQMNASGARYSYIGLISMSK